MLDYLPQEVVTEILVRLPVKPLLRFRCVCKEWLALILSPNFISQHLSHSSSSRNDRTLVRQCNVPDRGGEFYAVYNNYTFTKETTRFTFREMYGWLVVGYCNGVFCLWNSMSYRIGTIILWNPSIRRVIDVPSFRVRITILDTYFYAFGFGFDSVSNDYKIVKVFYRSENVIKLPTKVEVFSLSVGEWRLIESNVTAVIRRNLSSQAVKDNVLHWIGDKKDTEYSLIVSFNLNTEIFGEMSLPKPLECRTPPDTFLAMLRRLISVLCYDQYSTDKSCAIWVMKEYGKADSWSYQYNIDIEGGRLIGVLRNNALLVASPSGGLSSYDYEKRTSTVTGICRTKFVTYAGAYVESLVLVDEGREIPKGDSESDNEHEDRLKIKVSCSLLWSILPST